MEYSELPSYFFFFLLFVFLFTDGGPGIRDQPRAFNMLSKFPTTACQLHPQPLVNHDKAITMSPRLAQSHRHPASASQILELQLYILVPRLLFHFNVHDIAPTLQFTKLIMEDRK